MNEIIDKTETLLAHLICADASGKDNRDTGWSRHRGVSICQVDAGSLLRFKPMMPKLSYAFQSISMHPSPDDERLYTDDSAYLLEPVQDTIGAEAEIAFIDGNSVGWHGLRRLLKTPRNVWVASPGATLYEHHNRDVLANGESSYFQGICAVSKSGKPVPCVIEGTNKAGANVGKISLAIIAASIIEDAHRIDVLTATISDSTSIVLPVPIDEYKELFALREAPLTEGGRRKAIMHWVAQHLRKRRHSDKSTVVKEHIRGVREFKAGGMTVQLAPNQLPTPAKDAPA